MYKQGVSPTREINDETRTEARPLTHAQHINDSQFQFGESIFPSLQGLHLFLFLMCPCTHPVKVVNSKVLSNEVLV